MTKKDYKLIATAIKQARFRSDSQDYPTIDRVAEEIADKLQAANPRFDRKRFMAATNYLP